MALLAPPTQAQTNQAVVMPPANVVAKRGEIATGKITVHLRDGLHCNSNVPSDEYMIPLKLTWTAGPLESPEITYPPGKAEKYEFSPKPISVYTGEFEIVTRFKVPAKAASGTQTGKLKYQACSNNMCFPPRTIDVQLPVEVQ